MLILDFNNAFITKKTELEIPDINFNNDNEKDNKNKINYVEEDI